MSTPYVGLKQVFKQGPNGNGQSPETPQTTGDYRREVKRRLIALLENYFGVQTIQVGAFMMKLSEETPDRHLLKATHYLLEQYKQERYPSKAVGLLEECMRTLLRSL